MIDTEKSRLSIARIDQYIAAFDGVEADDPAAALRELVRAANEFCEVDAAASYVLRDLLKPFLPLLEKPT